MYNFDRHSITGIFLVIASAFCFSFQGITMKLLHQENVSIMAMFLLRIASFLPFFAVFFLVINKKLNVPRLELKYVIGAFFTGVLGYYIMPYLNFTALARMEASIERVLLFTYMIFVILLNAIIHKHRPHPLHVICFFIIQLGIFFLIGGASGKEITITNLSDTGLVMLGSFLLAIYVLLAQHLMKHLGMIYFIGIALIGAFFVILIQFISMNQISELYLSQRGFILIIIMTIISFPPAMMFAEGVRRIGSSRASLISSVSPVFTFLFAYIILDEIMDLYQLFGALIIIASVMMAENRLFRHFITHFVKK